MTEFTVHTLRSIVRVPDTLIEDQKIARAKLGGIRYEIWTDSTGYTGVRLIGPAEHPELLELYDEIDTGIDDAIINGTAGWVSE